MGWGMLWLFLALKIPLLALCWLVWWAIKQEPEPVAGEDDGGNQRTAAAPGAEAAARPAPRPARRGGAAQPAARAPAHARAEQPSAR